VVPAAEWDAWEERAVADIGRRNAPKVYGWYASAASDELRAAAPATVPPLVRVLFRLFWWPAHQRRARRVYGRHAPATVG
jgi:hypothetical protein